jgi:hypothetical protein
MTTPDIPARADAIARFEGFARGLERLGLQDFRLVVPGALGDEERGAWRTEAERLAEDEGILDVLRAARSAVGDHVTRVYAGGGFHPTVAGLNWGLSTGRAEDQAAAIEAVQDAVTAAVVEPLASPALVAGLRERFELIAAAHPMPAMDGDLPDLLGGRGWTGRSPIIAVVIVVAVLGWITGGWALLAIPVLVAGWLVRRRRG